MKLATWNVNSIKVRLPQVLEWLSAHQPDAFCLQETKTEDANFPATEIAAAGYEPVFSGQKTYNGIAILCRTKPNDVTAGIPGFDDPQKRVISASVEGLRAICVYIPNGESVESDKYRYKLDWLARLPERAAFRTLIGLGLADSFRLFDQPEKSFSWWDYRMNGFKRNLGLRIDHILLSQELVKRCTSCSIDRDMRAKERPSDHAPVVAEIEI
ncbi:MAG: exodeoxyribonuclease III [Deltaproteobacteria bacterium]|nr:exodeoxyribonuclease III [Deltaproteobacteria bacterium]